MKDSSAVKHGKYFYKRLEKQWHLIDEKDVSYVGFRQDICLSWDYGGPMIREGLAAQLHSVTVDK